LLDEPAATATHTPEAMASESAFNAVGADALPADELDSPKKPAVPA
jgi:hypothetical protein